MVFKKFSFKIEKQFRLKEWDYSQSGYYFITICTNNKINYFGEIKNQKINLTEIGQIALKNWNNIPLHFKNILLDEFCLMPNHLHGILIVNNQASLRTRPNIPKVGTHHDAFLQITFSPQS